MPSPFQLKREVTADVLILELRADTRARVSRFFAFFLAPLVVIAIVNQIDPNAGFWTYLLCPILLAAIHRALGQWRAEVRVADGKIYLTLTPEIVGWFSTPTPVALRQLESTRARRNTLLLVTAAGRVAWRLPFGVFRTVDGRTPAQVISEHVNSLLTQDQRRLES